MSKLSAAEQWLLDRNLPAGRKQEAGQLWGHHAPLGQVRGVPRGCRVGLRGASSDSSSKHSWIWVFKSVMPRI